VQFDRAVAWSVSGGTTPMSLRYRHYAPAELELLQGEPTAPERLQVEAGSDRAHSDDDMADWIAELRGRLDRGELAGLGPLDLGSGEFPNAEILVRVMLADLDDLYGGPSTRREQPLSRERRYTLSDELRRLRALIG
jgi:hypothetical protein